MLKLRGKKAKVVKHLIGWLDGFYFFFFCTSLFPRISQHCACIFWDHEGGRAEQKSTETQPLPFEQKLICFTKQLGLIYLWATFGYYITFFKKTSAFLIFFDFRTAVLWSPLRGATFFFFFFFDFVKIFLSTTAQNVFRAGPRRAVDTKVSDSRFVVIHLNLTKVASMRCVLKVRDFGTTGPGLHSDPRRVRDFGKKIAL